MMKLTNVCKNELVNPTNPNDLHHIQNDVFHITILESNHIILVTIMKYRLDDKKIDTELHFLSYEIFNITYFMFY